LGYAPAQYIIGNFNEKGIGVEKNMARAVSWYELAAESGNVVAMHNLGVIYATPGTVADEPDMENAFRWFNEAADHGVRDSQVNMGIFHTRGIGTNVDLVEAYKWFAVASASGDVDAKSKLTVIKEALRPEQLAEAKVLVESWKPETADKAANEVQVSEAWKDQTAQVAQPVPVSKTTIAQMQAVLARLGYNPGPADGIMGQRTRDAIVAYRKKAGLDGGEQVDAALLRSLTAAISG
jgi:localization factor PodJL